MTEETAKKICDMNTRTYNRIASLFSGTRMRPWNDCAPLAAYLSDGMSILDIGCGNGRLFTMFSQDKNIAYTGIDVSTKLIQEAQRIYGKDSRQPRFFAGDILLLQDIPDIQEKKYDVVSAIAVLNHIPSCALQMRALAQMRLFLKPGGMLFLTNWNLLRIGGHKNIWRYVLEKYRIPDTAWQGKYGFSKKELGFRDCITTWKSGVFSEPLYYYSFTLCELARLLCMAGFTAHNAYYSKNGTRAHWWDGWNSIVIAQSLDREMLKR